MNTKSAYNSIERPALEPPRERVAYLDGWRGLAIIMVVIGHFFTVRIFSLAPFGVEFFFVLSGRLMAEILFVEKFSLPKFYIRRISRIFPALIVFSIGCFLLVYKTHLHYKPTGILAAISMTYNYIAAFGHRVGAIDHIWSLCIEEHAYIIMGITAWFSRRWSFSVSLVLACIALASMADGVFSAIVLHQDWFTDYWRTDAHLGSIVGSAALYLLSREAGGGGGA